MTAIASSSAAYTPFPRAKGLDVASIVPDPFAYRGEINVRGAVSNVEAEMKTFTIIDYREYRAHRPLRASSRSPGPWRRTTLAREVSSFGRRRFR
jgi:hypothetical protein